MCGICGIAKAGKERVDEAVLARMADVLSHRGPDDAGFFIDAGIGLGFRRLSIIDLAGGRQPMPNEDGSVQVVFNGTIYNFRELREELAGRGHIFRTASDTESIVHGYEEWGDEVVQHLNGMFAFAVWDGRRRRLLLGRDRIGLKPLFYSIQRNTLAFASEIKSLLQLPEFDPAIALQGVADYFSYLYIPGPATIYSGIHQLMPGSRLVFEDGKMQVGPYWEPTLTAAPARSVDDWCEEFRHVLFQVVARQMVADVPIGVWLSGGIDSSAVTAAMVRACEQPVRSFNVGFDVAEYDETFYAATVSRALGTVHDTFRLSSSTIDILPKLLWYMDQPFADATIIPAFFLSERTRQHVKVVLSGEGGDELFAGYTHYQGMRLNEWLRRVPAGIRTSALKLLGQLPAFGSMRLGFLRHRAERVMASAMYPAFEDYMRKVAPFTPDEQKQLFTREFLEAIRSVGDLDAMRMVAARHDGLDPVAQACLADLSVYLPGDLLAKVDRMSMACSLEARAPLLDNQMIDLALSIPIGLKLKGFCTKYIMRAALKTWLPPGILKRPKRGFNPPLKYWLQHSLTDYAAAYHMFDVLQEIGFFHLDYVKALGDEHRQGRRDHSRKLYALLVFAVWWRRVRGMTEMPG